MTKFKYTGPSGQKVGFGLVEIDQVYEVPDETAPILEADADFKKLTGKTAEAAEAVPAWPEPATEPAVPVDPAAAVALDLDSEIISFQTPSAPASSWRSTPKK